MQRGDKIQVLKKTKTNKWAEEMGHWLSSLAALPEDTGLIPSTHMAAHSYQSPLFLGI